MTDKDLLCFWQLKPMVSLQQASELVRETEGQSSAADVPQHWILAGQQCSSDSTLPFFCPQRACMAEGKENLCRKLFVAAVESDSDAPEHIHILYFIYIYIWKAQWEQEPQQKAPYWDSMALKESWIKY